MDCVNTDSSAVTDSELISGDVMSANVMDETQNDLDQIQFLVVSEDDERSMRQLIEDISRNSRCNISGFVASGFHSVIGHIYTVHERWKDFVIVEGDKCPPLGSVYLNPDWRSELEANFNLLIIE